MIRAIILAATIATLVCLWREQPPPEPPPSRFVQVDYCWITYKAAGKDQFGNLHTGWTQGFGPCAELDRYENT